MPEPEVSRVVLNDLAGEAASDGKHAEVSSAGQEPSMPSLARGARRGTIAAMAMTGLREFTLHAGILDQSPPEAIAWRGLGRLRRRPQGAPRAVLELAHWGYGAAGGAAYAVLPASVRGRPWSGPAYGLLIWLSFEMVIAPALSLPQAKRVRLLDRAALAVDHLLYGLVLAGPDGASRG
jgi:hypothetical protein